MHFLMPHVFASHRDFKEWFSNPMTGMIEGSREYNEDLIRRLHKVSCTEHSTSNNSMFRFAEISEVTGLMLNDAGVAAIPAAKVESRRGEADAEEVRTRHHVSFVQAAALPLR